MAGADHLLLKDFKLLRRAVHSHMVNHWYWYSPFYTFPLSITIWSGDHIYTKVVSNENLFFRFLRTEESMFAVNSSQAEIVALSNVLQVDIHLLTYNIQGMVGRPENRTHWSIFPAIADLAYEVIFSNRCAGEVLKILHEDEVHYMKMIWMGTTGGDEDPIPETRFTD